MKPPKGHVRTCYINEPIYGCAFVVAQGPLNASVYAITHLLTKKNPYTTSDGGLDFPSPQKEAGLQGSCTWTKDRRVVAIWLAPEADSATLAHELWHGVCQILRDRGLKLTGASEEAWCYLHTYLFRQIAEGLKNDKR